jgi:hypothetical protein
VFISIFEETSMSYGGGQLGGGGFFGGGGSPGPQGPFGVWPSLGCSSVVIVLAGMLLVCGGCLRMVGQ